MSNAKKKPTKKFEKPKIVSLDWEDHWSGGGSWNIEKDHNPLICKAAGIVIYEDRKVIQLSTHVDPASETHGNIMTILKKCVTKRKNLT